MEPLKEKIYKSRCRSLPCRVQRIILRQCGRCMWCLTQNRSYFKGHVYTTHSEICPLHLTRPPLRSRGRPPCSAWIPDPDLPSVHLVEDCQRNWSTRREPTRTRGEHANSPQGTEPRPLALRGDSANHYASLAADMLQVSAVAAPVNENRTFTDRMSCLTAPIP